MCKEDPFLFNFSFLTLLLKTLLRLQGLAINLFIIHWAISFPKFFNRQVVLWAFGIFTYSSFNSLLEINPAGIIPRMQFSPRPLLLILKTLCLPDRNSIYISWNSLLIWLASFVELFRVSAVDELTVVGGHIQYKTKWSLATWFFNFGVS